MTQITDSDREERNSLLKLIDCMGDDNDCWRIDQAFARHRIQALSTQAAELDALRGEVARLDTTPWKDFHGDLPDYDHPLRCVYESGIQYAVNLLAATLKVDDWEICDGTEEFDGDLGGTLFSIFLAALPTDQHGDPMYPSEIAATIAQLRDRVAKFAEILETVLPYTEAERLREEADVRCGRTYRNPIQKAVNKARALLTQNEVG